MQIFITRGEDSSGPYTLEQVQDYLSQGVLLAGDLAWHEGLDNWIPLEQLIAEVSPPEEPPHPAQEGVVAPALSEPEPVVAEVVPAPGKGKSKTELIIVAVAALLVVSGLGVGAWVLLKKDPSQQAENKEPGKPADANKTPEANTNLPPSPTPNPPTPETGKPGTALWEFETGDWVSSSPAIGSDGTVYVGSNHKKLYAIKTDSKGPAKSPWPMRGQNARHTGRQPKPSGK